jgi:hypothetical protein
MSRAGLYAGLSALDQQTLPLQIRAMREYTANRGWTICVQIKEFGFGAVERDLRQRLINAARRRCGDWHLRATVDSFFHCFGKFVSKRCVWQLQSAPVIQRSDFVGKGNKLTDEGVDLARGSSD